MPRASGALLELAGVELLAGPVRIIYGFGFQQAASSQVWSWCLLSPALSANSSAVIIAIFYAVATVGIYGSMLDVTPKLALWRCISACNLRRIVRKEKSRAPKNFAVTL